MHVPRNIQSPYVANDFWTQWSSITPRMTCCVKITPRDEFGGDAAAVGLTSNTRDMVLPGHAGITFKATPSMTPSVIEAALDEASNLEMTGIYQAGIFTHAEVLAGKWNFAEFEIFSVCWDNVNLGEFLHGSGNLGKITDYQNYFTVEGRGKLALLSADVNDVTSRFCRVHKFRDAECGHTASTVTINSVVYNIEQASVNAIVIGLVVNCYTLTMTGNRPPDGFFANGEITGLSGPNDGVSREIVTSEFVDTGNSFTDYIRIYLKLPFPYDASLNGYSMVAGCDRTLEACMMYGNIINRRAEDYIPNVETLTRLPTA